MGEGSLKQVGHIFLDEHLVGGGAGGVQRCSDLPLLHQVEHVGQDGRVHRQACSAHTHTRTQKIENESIVFP